MCALAAPSAGPPSAGASAHSSSSVHATSGVVQRSRCVTQPAPCLDVARVCLETGTPGLGGADDVVQRPGAQPRECAHSIRLVGRTRRAVRKDTFEFEQRVRRSQAVEEVLRADGCLASISAAAVRERSTCVYESAIGGVEAVSEEVRECRVQRRASRVEQVVLAR